MIHTLEVDSVQLEFDRRTILSDVYMKCEMGKITGLLGRNGQGKSCLMKVMYGELKCDKSVRFDNISCYEAFKKPDLLMYLPQFNFIPRALTLRRIFKDFDLDYSFFENLFPEFIKKQSASISSLSGGEQRLIELYIVVKSNSQFAMLDEPFTHLSPIQIEKAKDLLLSEKENKGLLITDHLYRHITSISDNVYVLVNGKTHLIKSMEDIEVYGYARL